MKKAKWAVAIILPVIIITGGYFGWESYQDWRFFSYQHSITTLDSSHQATTGTTLRPVDTERRRAEKAELTYYLDRHNVQDEGYEMIAGYATRLEADTIISEDSPIPPLHIWSAAKWKSVPRQGTGVTHDTNGNTLVAVWVQDTIATGIRIDSTGIYRGDFDRWLNPSGHGTFTASDSAYYEGHWQNGMRQGFGFLVNGQEHLKAGEWRTDKYLGERMNYTTERIYGIDIARYQHGKGRKKYPILWKQLRITHLGTISKKRVSGTVNYPVSFIYIKSTEGRSIVNRWYRQDYLQARRHGYHVGAYHFFSTRSTAAQQAQWFLSHTYFRHGDFPPVLDVEPTEQEIARMGGPAVLFDRVRTWLSIVRRRTGVKPILYVGQNFVNKYLSQAPDIKRDYKVWIARYGEYKPDVKLVYWQLCPDGRVSGIQGAVDINVFNGFRDQFNDFLANDRIP